MLSDQSDLKLADRKNEEKHNATTNQPSTIIPDSEDHDSHAVNSCFHHVFIILVTIFSIMCVRPLKTFGINNNNYYYYDS